MNLPNFPYVDLFSAGINALNGVLVARHPSHRPRLCCRGVADHGFLRRSACRACRWPGLAGR
jgi:hypothetical protein